jgi:hypothetical protein
MELKMYTYLIIFIEPKHNTTIARQGIKETDQLDTEKGKVQYLVH